METNARSRIRFCLTAMRARATPLRLVGTTAAIAAARVFAQELAPAEDLFRGVPQQIEELQSSQGINSPDLVAPLTSMGLIFREQGDVDLAIAAFERARHLVRVNYGLFSFKEAPLLRQLVQIEEARGNFGAAWDLEQKLIGFIRGSPGPRPAAASMLREIADKRVDVLERYSAGARVKLNLLDEALSYYYDVMDMIRFSEGWSSDDLSELEMSVLRAMYAARNDYNTEHRGRGLLFVVHERYVKYSAPLPVQMNALVQMADWDLLFAGGREKNAAAFQAYEALYDQLKQTGLEQRFIDAIFSPSVPVVLPTFSPNRLVATETPVSSGYIDVAFEITKYGEAKAIEILDTTTNIASDAAVRLTDLIKRSRFRPRMAGGVFEDRSRVVVRYYVND